MDAYHHINVRRGRNKIIKRRVTSESPTRIGMRPPPAPKQSEPEATGEQEEDAKPENTVVSENAVVTEAAVELETIVVTETTVEPTL